MRPPGRLATLVRGHRTTHVRHTHKPPISSPAFERQRFVVLVAPIDRRSTTQRVSERPGPGFRIEFRAPRRRRRRRSFAEKLFAGRAPHHPKPTGRSCARPQQLVERIVPVRLIRFPFCPRASIQTHHRFRRAGPVKQGDLLDSPPAAVSAALLVAATLFHDRVDGQQQQEHTYTLPQQP